MFFYCCAVCIDAQKQELLQRLIRMQNRQMMRSTIITVSVIVAVVVAVVTIVTLAIFLRPGPRSPGPEQYSVEKTNYTNVGRS